MSNPLFTPSFLTTPVAIPFGDPNGMRVRASILDVQADALADMGRSLLRKFNGVDFQCKAQKRFRRDFADAQGRADSGASHLRKAASTLRTEAARLEREIESARLREQQRQQQLAAHVAKQKK